MLSPTLGAFVLFLRFLFHRHSKCWEEHAFEQFSRKPAGFIRRCQRQALDLPSGHPYLRVGRRAAGYVCPFRGTFGPILWQAASGTGFGTGISAGTNVYAGCHTFLSDRRGFGDIVCSTLAPNRWVPTVRQIHVLRLICLRIYLMSNLTYHTYL